MQNPMANDCQDERVKGLNQPLWDRGAVRAVLLVTDGRDWAPTKDTLSGWGVDIHVATSGAEAIAQIRRTNADVILAVGCAETTMLFRDVQSRWPDENIAQLWLTEGDGTEPTVEPVGSTPCSTHWTPLDADRLRHALKSRELRLTVQNKELRIQTLIRQGIQEAHQVTDFFGYAQRSLCHLEANPTDSDVYPEMMATYVLRRTLNDHTRPTMVLVTRRDTNGRHSGFLYSRTGARVQRHPGPLKITAKRAGAIFGRNGTPQRWLDTDGNKSPFGRALKRVIGPLNNYVSTETTDWGLIAINADHPATDNTAFMLQSVLQHAQTLLAVASQMTSANQRSIAALQALVRTAAPTVEQTQQRDERVNEISGLLASAMGCSERFVAQICAFAHLCDVGNAALPVSLIHKRAPLTDQDWEKIHAHPLHGARLIGDEPALGMAHEIALCHHERFDGSGYPYGLRGEEIPLAARIVTVADVYSALRSPRPYRAPKSHSEAVQSILHGDSRISPAHFDPNVLAVFQVRSQDIADIYDGTAEPCVDSDSATEIQALA